MSLSSVAGIVEQGGGFRVVVTQRWRMRHHVRKGERLFVVPDLLVQEPVPWEQIPSVIAKAQKHTLKTLAPKNSCGECRACCITPYIDDPALRKPSHQTCTNCDTEVGCMLYWNRPKLCRAFECVWLKSQSRNDVMAPELRPDRCGVIFTDDTTNTDPDILEVHPDTRAHEPLNNPVVVQFIEEQQTKMGRKAKLITHYIGEKR